MNASSSPIPSPVLKDIENMGAQNPSRIFIPAADPKKSTHKLVVKEPQPNFGSDDYECGTRDLYLFSGENALRLDRGVPSSVLVDPQEESNTIVPVIIVSQGPFAIKDNQFLCIDLVDDTDLVTIKDFREVVARLPDTSQGGATDDQENHRVLVEIATASSPSRYEELPRRELRVLLPGDRVRLASKSTRPLVLEYIFDRVPGPKAAEAPPPGTSRNSLKQPQEKGRRETQIDIGSPPRIRADLINSGLLPQPQEVQDDQEDEEDKEDEEEAGYGSDDSSDPALLGLPPAASKRTSPTLAPKPKATVRAAAFKRTSPPRTQKRKAMAPVRATSVAGPPQKKKKKTNEELRAEASQKAKVLMAPDKEQVKANKARQEAATVPAMPRTEVWSEDDLSGKTRVKLEAILERMNLPTKGRNKAVLIKRILANQNLE